MTQPISPDVCAGLLKVLADETRLAVVQQLLERPRRVGEINESLQLEPSLLSHHLKVLRDAGLVLGEREGKSVVYQLAPAVRSESTDAAVDLGCCSISFNEPIFVDGPTVEAQQDAK